MEAQRLEGDVRAGGAARDITDDIGNAISQGGADLGDIPDDLKDQAGDVLDRKSVV